MDADLAAMRSFEKYRKCVDHLLQPLLEERALYRMPCKHNATFESANAARRQKYLDLGLEDPGDDTTEREGYCDCTPFNRRNELWEIGELCVKKSLTVNQLTDMSHILLLKTKDSFTYNHVNRAMRDAFAGKYETYLKHVSKKRGEGVSFGEIASGVVPEWQYRMMPNI